MRSTVEVDGGCRPPATGQFAATDLQHVGARAGVLGLWEEFVKRPRVADELRMTLETTEGFGHPLRCSLMVYCQPATGVGVFERQVHVASVQHVDCVAVGNCRQCRRAQRQLEVAFYGVDGEVVVGIMLDVLEEHADSKVGSTPVAGWDCSTVLCRFTLEAFSYGVTAFGK